MAVRPTPRPERRDLPIALIDRGHRIAFKWHRARQRAGDSAFTAARIAQAMRAGASVEIDLVLCADGRFVVLHDKDLAGATTGRGSVRDHPADAVAMLHRRADDGTALAERVLTLDGLAALLADGPVHPDALLQLDIKEEAGAVTPAAIGYFADAVAPFAAHAIASCGDADTVRLLTDPLPGLRIGHDPCHGGAAERAIRDGDYEGFVERALLDAPRAAMMYLQHELVLTAGRDGHDLIDAFHRTGRTVDAYTIAGADRAAVHQVRRLIDLGVDQITADDAEGLMAELMS